MNSLRWASIQRTVLTRSAQTTAPLARFPSLRTVHAPSRAAHTTLQPQLKPWAPWTVRLPQLRPSRTARCVRYNSSKPSPNPTPSLGSPTPAPSLKQRLKHLSKEYGWAALGVYLLLTALDFPFCFLAVRMLGTERIGQWEHVIVEKIMGVVRIPFPNLGKKDFEPVAIGEAADGEMATGDSTSVPHPANASKNGDASIWTQLALAYAIHKSFIFIRVPLTAALTPKIVKTLRGWGWNIGKANPASK